MKNALMPHRRKVRQKIINTLTPRSLVYLPEEPQLLTLLLVISLTKQILTSIMHPKISRTRLQAAELQNLPPTQCLVSSYVHHNAALLDKFHAPSHPMFPQATPHSLTPAGSSARSG
jgi:hypothetical protein